MFCSFHCIKEIWLCYIATAVAFLILSCWSIPIEYGEGNVSIGYNKIIIY